MNLEKYLFKPIKKAAAILTLAAVLAGCQPHVYSKPDNPEKETITVPVDNPDSGGETIPPVTPTPNPLTTTNPVVDNYDYTPVIRNVASQTIEALVGGAVEVMDVTSYLKGTKLTIPSGALSSNTQISVSEVDNPPSLPSGLSYIGSAINLEPDGLNFSNTVTIQIPYYDNFLSDAGISDDSNLKLYSYNKSSQSWEEINITSLDTTNNILTAKINHFSYYAITCLNGIPPEDLGTPQPGDLIYTLGAFWNQGDSLLKDNWMPGHVGVCVGEKVFNGVPYNVIHAIATGVTRSYFNPISNFSGENLFMGAREPKDSALTPQQRIDIVNFVEAQVGKPYAWAQTIGALFGMLEGRLVKGPNSFNCVGLAEKAYEIAGVNDGAGLVYTIQEDGIEYSFGALTPAEQYNATKPASGKNPITAKTIILQPGQEGKDSFRLNYKEGNLTINGSGCNEYYLRVDNYSNEENYSVIRSFIEFPIPDLPKNSEISSAILKLSCPEGLSPDYNKMNISIKKIISPWEETIRDCPAYEGEVVSHFQLVNNLTEYNIDISSLVQDWINGSSPNYGLVILSEGRTQGEPGINGFKFYSGDYIDDPSKHPRLKIDYWE